MTRDPDVTLIRTLVPFGNPASSSQRPWRRKNGTAEGTVVSARLFAPARRRSEGRWSPTVRSRSSNVARGVDSDVAETLANERSAAVDCEIAMVILCVRVAAVRRLAVLLALSGAAVGLSNCGSGVVPIDNIAGGLGGGHTNRLCKRSVMRGGVADHLFPGRLILWRFPPMRVTQ